MRVDDSLTSFPNGEARGFKIRALIRLSYANSSMMD